MLPYDISFQATGNYRSRGAITQGHRRPNASLDLGFRKTFFGKKLAVVGYSNNMGHAGFVLFDKRKGAVDSKGKTLKKHLNATPMVLQEQGMSLWNVALEIHVGRFFISLIPELSSAFYVYCTGIIILLVLLEITLCLSTNTK